MKKEQTNSRKTRLLLLLAVVLCIAMLAVVLTFAIPAYTGRSTLEGTLEQYYSAIYLGEGGIDALIDCVIPANQEDTYNRLTSGGTSFSFMARWQSECLGVVGENPSLSVKILEEAEDSRSYLSTIQETYHKAENFSLAAFQLDLKGDAGTESLTGVAQLIYQDGRWYVTGDTIELSVLSRDTTLMD